MISASKVANAVGGKTARACDGCLRRRARWFCAADDAFLCQACDASVHSANQLAGRHERVRLETASRQPSEPAKTSSPAWHHGFTRKARTPRNPKRTAPFFQSQPNKEKGTLSNTFPLVPEICNEDGSTEESEQQLLHRVPIFDPFSREFCNETVLGSDLNAFLGETDHEEGCDLDNFPGFLPSDVELEQFAVDVGSLLGTGLEEDSGGMEALGLMECKEEDAMMINDCFEEKRVKVEEIGEAVMAFRMDSTGLEMERESLDWNFDFEEEDEEKKVMGASEQKKMESQCCSEEEIMRRKRFLRLDYEAVITAWATQGSPWTTGARPEFNPDDCWSHFMGLCPSSAHHPYQGVGGRMGGGSGGREARVSRYREKRRARLFSKKIRYEVRKLNAEKRPRIKGRFVKSQCFAGPVFPYFMKK